MIDEKKLMEDIEDDAKRILDYVFREVLSEFVDDYLKQMEYLINDQQKISEWIPCNKRLPEAEKEVIVCTQGHLIRVWSLYVGDNISYWEDEDGYWDDFDEVIAWMPLPEPYKE